MVLLLVDLDNNQEHLVSFLYNLGICSLAGLDKKTGKNQIWNISNYPTNFVYDDIITITMITVMMIDGDVMMVVLMMVRMVMRVLDMFQCVLGMSPHF